MLALYGPAFQTWLLLREEPGSRLSASIKRMLVFTPASRLGRLNLFLALWKTTWASVKHEKQYMPPPSCSGAPKVQRSSWLMLSIPAENREKPDCSFLCQWWAFRLAKTVISDLGHISCASAPFILHLLFSACPWPLSPHLPTFTLFPSDFPPYYAGIFSSHHRVTEDPTSPNSLGLTHVSP